MNTSKLLSCAGAQNETVLQCPNKVKYSNEKEFIVLAHNPQPKAFSQMVRVKLRNNKYKP